jgi:hypothetical protein
MGWWFVVKGRSLAGAKRLGVLQLEECVIVVLELADCRGDHVKEQGGSTYRGVDLYFVVNFGRIW